MSARSLVFRISAVSAEFWRARLEALKHGLFFRDALVQVLALQVCEVGREQPGISLDIALMAADFGSTEVSHHRHLVEMVKRCPSGWGGEFAMGRDSAAECGVKPRGGPCASRLRAAAVAMAAECGLALEVFAAPLVARQRGPACSRDRNDRIIGDDGIEATAGPRCVYAAGLNGALRISQNRSVLA